MPNPKFEGLAWRLALNAMTTALAVGFGASTALAEGPEISLSPTEVNTSVFPEPVEIEVAGTEFEAYEESDVAVGICTYEGFGMFGIPACGAFAEEVSIESGNLTSLLELTSSVIANDHAGLPGQPPTFQCEGKPAPCRVIVADHPEGSGQQIVAERALPFS
jgi:hypothetical protein